MRIQHIIIAVMIFALFGVIMFSESRDFLDATGVNATSYLDNATSGNAASTFDKLNVITSTKNNISEMADKSAGGIDSNLPLGDSTTQEGGLAQAGLSTVAAAGRFLFSVPRLLIQAVGEFLHIRQEFLTVATAILVLIVSIILVSSVLRNRI